MIFKQNKHTAIATIAILFSVIFNSIAFAAKPVYSGGRERAAIRGYDPVSYFTDGKPVKGSKEFEFKYKGAKWLFSSENNLILFKNNPEKFSPQYGGYCAYAVSKGSTASIKPEYFTIHGGKLYLNFSKSVYKKWIKDKDSYISSANKEWPELIN